MVEPVGTQVASSNGPPSVTHAFCRHEKTFRLVDLPLLVAFTGLFWLFLTEYAFDGQLSEWDLYLAAVGLWNGYHTGEEIAGTIHYGKWHSFGYILLIYLIGSSETFDPGYNLFQLMNGVGFWATLACLPLMWFAVANTYGRRVAWSATVIFVGSPVFLEVAGGAHPLLLALATLFLGSIVLGLPARGVAGLLLKLLSAIILTAALSFRLEVILAFPFLVLTPLPRETNISLYIRGLIARLAATFGATLSFFFTRILFVPGDQNKVTEFITDWYSFENLPIGFVALSFAVGFVSLLALVWSVAKWLSGMKRENLKTAIGLLHFAQVAAPAAMMFAVLVFWIANPLPARHFLLFSLGTSIIIAVTAAKALRAQTTIALSLLLVVGNQLFSAALNPIAIKASNYSTHRDWPYLLTSPSGFAWERRAMLKEIWSQHLTAGEKIAEGRCGERFIISAELSPAVVAAFYSQKPSQRSTFWDDRESDLGLQVMKYPQNVMVYTRASIQQPPVPASLIGDPRFANWNFLVLSPRSDGKDQRDVPAHRNIAAGCIGEGAP